MRPLADMTEEERAEARGQWCEDIYGDLYIYLGHTPGGTAHEEETGALMGTFIDPQEPDIIEAPLAAFASRPDLPRAWTADGQPPTAEWEHEYTGTDGCSLTTGEKVSNAGPSQKIRRWIGDWEKA